MGSNPSKQKALHRAVIDGDVDTLSDLLTDKAILRHLSKCQPVNCFTKWWSTPLILAAEKGHAGCVRKLVEAGANPNCQDEFGNTALHRAVACNHISCVELLLGSNIDVNRQTYLTTRTALHMAASSGYGNIVELFTTHTGCDIDKQNNSGLTPLGLACNRGNYSCVDILLRKGANPQKKVNGGDSPLEEALRNENVDILVLLLEAMFGFYLTDPDFDMRLDPWTGIHRITQQVLTARSFDVACFHSFLTVFLKNNAYLFPNTNISPEQANENLALCNKVVVDVLQATDIACMELSYGHSIFYNFVLSHGDTAFSLLVFRLLAAAGHNWSDAEKRYISSNYSIDVPDPKLLTIQTLRHMCRLKIRKLLGYCIVSNVRSLHIPTRLKDYVLLRDIEYSAENFLETSLQ